MFTKHQVKELLRNHDFFTFEDLTRLMSELGYTVNEWTVSPQSSQTMLVYRFVDQVWADGKSDALVQVILREKPHLAEQCKENRKTETHGEFWTKIGRIFERKSTNQAIDQRHIKIYVEGDFPSLSPDRQSAAIDAFAAIMGISAQQIQIYRVHEGSIVFDLGVPSSAVRQLGSLLQSNSARLHLLRVKRVILGIESGQTEQWVAVEKKFERVGRFRFLSMPENREITRQMSLEVAGELGPAEAELSKKTIGTLLDMLMREELPSRAGSNVPLRFPKADLVLLDVVPIVAQILQQLVDRFDEQTVEEAKAQVRNTCLEQILQTKLDRLLQDCFDQKELQDLCVHLGIDYESLPAEDKSEKAHEMVAYCERHGRTGELVVAIRQRRPNIIWGNTLPGKLSVTGTVQKDSFLCFEIMFLEQQLLTISIKHTASKREMRKIAILVAKALQAYLEGDDEI